MNNTFTDRERTASLLKPAKQELKIDITKRLHGIDALRGIAMLLGILLHATIAYKEHPLPLWPHDPGFTHWSFDYLYFLVHSFRMPLFFLIAGYFCRFLIYRIGEKEFIIHRVKRILVPFIFSMVLILPLTIYPFLVYRYGILENRENFYEAAFRGLFRWNGMAHLWFLYFLLIYYFFVIVLFSLKQKGIAFISGLSSLSHKFKLDNFLNVLLATVPILLILSFVPDIYLHVDTGIIPGLPYLSFFGYFFLLGWIINRDAAKSFSWIMSRTWFFLATGVILSIVLFWFEFTGRYEAMGTPGRTGIKALAGIQMTALVFGSIGFFLTFWRSESKTWKYLSDASYWMYLVHLAVVAMAQVILREIAIPGYAKFMLILGGTMVFTLVTYHAFIRYTIVGEWLHGKRK